MRQNITVGVAHRALIERELDASDYQLAAFFQAMEVVPYAAADTHALEHIQPAAPALPLQRIA